VKEKNLLFIDLLSTQQSIGEIIRYRISPHIKLILAAKAKKEEETKKPAVAADKKDGNKKGELKNEKKETKSAITIVSMDENKKNVEADLIKYENELKELEKIKKENINMVCYGLPDVIMQLQQIPIS
jgi:hypothetical protein